MPNRPIMLLDLNSACHSLGLLVFCASDWIPFEELKAFSDAVRPHLEAARATIAEAAERNSYLLGLRHKDGADKIVPRELASLQHYLSGRTSIGPGNPLHLPPRSETDLD